jgi:anti-sigma factor RsiW
LTRTSRLQRTINTNLDLLGRLPAEHPNRATLEAHNGELLTLLVRRQQRRFGPFTQAGVSFGALAGVAAVALVFACFSALLAAGVIPSSSASDPPDPGDGWAAAVFFVVMAASFAVAAVIAARRQLREHPPPAQQPTEAG